MNRIAQAKARQDLVVGTVGGTVLHANHRMSDTVVALVGVLRDIAALGPRDRNLSSVASTHIAGLAEDFPLVVTAEGEVTEAVAAEAAALVEDPSVLGPLGIIDAVDAAFDAVESVLAEADCYLDAEDGVAIYAMLAPDDEDESV